LGIYSRMEIMKKILLLVAIILFFENCEMQPKSYKYGIPEEEFGQILFGLLNTSDTAATETEYGTVKFTNGGLEWKKCAQGQVYRSTDKDCQGASSPTNFTPNDLKYGATRHAYCNEASDACNSEGLNPILDSDETSTDRNITAFVTCQSDATGVSSGVTSGSWRVPTQAELMALAALGKISTLKLFPNTPDDTFWSATSDILDLEGELAKAVEFGPSGSKKEKLMRKDTKNYIRCVRNY
jgi:hypothetical protein